PDDCASLDEPIPAIRAGEPLHSKPCRREKQIADRMRRLHRSNDAELGETRNVLLAQNLRVLHPPANVTRLWMAELCDAGLAGVRPSNQNVSFFRRHGFERVLVKIENSALGAVSDRVCLDLNA